jgi:flagellar hook-associated protein 3
MEGIGMRVTNGMISSQTVFNMQRSLRRFMNLETNMSTGRRINTPSDDPIGTVRDLDYRTQLTNITQFRKNIGVAQNWQNNYDSILSDVKDYVSSAKEIAVAMANGTYDDASREASANDVQSLFEQIVALSNNELEGRRVFGGYQTKSKPFTIGGAGVTFSGDTGVLEFDVDSGQRTIVNLSGRDVFLKQLSILGEKANLEVALTGDTLLSNLNNGSGINLTPGTFTIKDNNLNISATIDLTTAPPATTVNDAITRINATLTAAGITNLTAAISASKNSLVLTPTQNGLISGSTRLDRLNNGVGVNSNPGLVHVSDGSGINFNVDLSGADNVSDVISKFNAQMSANGISNVTMSINPSGKGLQIVDSNGVPLNLNITNASLTDETASQLGIVGSIGASLTGTDLNPQVDFAIAETTGTTATSLGINSSFTGIFTGNDLDPLLTVNSKLSDLQNGLGVEQAGIVLRQGQSMVTINLSSTGLVTVQDLLNTINGSGLDVTASLNSSGKGIQIINNDPDKSFTIEEEATGRAAKSLGLFGSSDMMGSLTVLTNALRKDDQEGTGLLLENLDAGIQQLLNSRATIGARANQLGKIDNRLIDSNLSFTQLLSAVEDADLPSVISDLTTYENAYKAALNATARIIQPSLLDFLD